MVEKQLINIYIELKNKKQPKNKQTHSTTVAFPHEVPTCCLNPPAEQQQWSRQTKGDVTAAQSSHWHIPHGEHTQWTQSDYFHQLPRAQHRATRGRLGDSTASKSSSSSRRKEKPFPQPLYLLLIPLSMAIFSWLNNLREKVDCTTVSMRSSNQQVCN